MAKGGKRQGAGRPKGSREPKFLERDRVLKALQQRIMKKADRILDAQFTLAAGMSFLYRIDKDEDGNRQKPKMVTNPDEISCFLEKYTLEESGEVDGNYYYVTTAKPDGYAIDSMFNRAFGRPPQPQTVTGADGGPVKHVIVLENHIERPVRVNKEVPPKERLQ